VATRQPVVEIIGPTLVCNRVVIRSYGSGSTTDRVTNDRSPAMPSYRMVYGDDDKVVTETYDDVEVQREDGWVVLFRGSDAILRVQEAHVKSLDLVE
jgi:hypothetical protein